MLSAALGDEEAMARIMEQNNRRLAARTTLAHNLADINTSQAFDSIAKLYEAQTLPIALSGGNKYSGSKVQANLDPEGAFPDWVFVTEENLVENITEYMDKADAYNKNLSELRDIGADIEKSFELDVWDWKTHRVDDMVEVLEKMLQENIDIADDIGMTDELKKAIEMAGKTGGYENTMAFINYVRAISASGAGSDKDMSKKARDFVSKSQGGMDANVQNFIKFLEDSVTTAFGEDVVYDLISPRMELQEATQRKVQEFLTGLFVDLDMPDDVKYMTQQLISQALGFEWRDFQTPLEQWHKNYNAFTEEMRNSLKENLIEIPFPLFELGSGDKTREDLRKDLEEEIKAAKEVISTYESNISDGFSRLATAEEVIEIKRNVAIRRIMAAKGFDEILASEYLANNYIEAMRDYASDVSDIQYVAGNFSTFEYDEKKAQLPFLEQAFRYLGGGDDKKANSSAAKDAIKAINDVHKAFKDLQKDFDDGTAKVGAWEKYGKALEEALKPFGMSVDKFKSMFDLTTEAGMIQAFEWLKKQNAAAKELYEIERAIGDVTWELDIENKNKADEELNREIEELFSGYELSIELEDLHIPKDLAQKFFDIDVTDINQLRKELYSRKDEFVGTEQLEEYQNFLDKLDEMEAKSQQDRLKKYLEFSRDTMGERGKILFESFGELQDIAKAFELTDTLAKNEGLISDEQLKKMREAGMTFNELMSKDKSELMSDTWGFTQEDIDKIEEYNALLEEQQAIAEDAARKRTNEELAKFDWEKFTGSKVYQDLYNDMSSASSAALTVLITKLEEHRDQWSQLPVDQVEEYVRLLEEAKDALANTKFPSEIISDAKEVMDKSGYSDSGDASQAMINAQLEIEALDIAISQWETIAQLKKEGYQAEEISLMLNISEEKINAKSADDLKEQKTHQESIVSKSKDYLAAVRKIQDAYNKQRENLDKIKSCVDKVWEGWDDINSIFGDDNMSTAIAGMVKGVSDATFGMGDMILATKSAIEGFKAAEGGAQAMGFAIDTASGILGIIVMGIKLVATVLKFAFEQHDKVLQEQIDAQIDKVDILKKEYEALEEQIEKAYTAVDLGRLTRDANDNLQDQIAATQRMINLERQKKDSDQDKIDDWEDEISEMRKTMEENWDEAFSTLTDGILDNVLDTTRGFVDAWYDAFSETGDGMKGLEENFRDMLLSMLKQQASMQLISPYIDNYKKWLKDYVDPESGDNTLSIEDARMWAEKVRGTFPEIDNLLTNFFEGASDILESDYGELSGLEKGIQGMTEDQAEVLAAYWNSCRFLLSNIDVTLTKLAESVMSNNPSSTTMLNELRTQTTVLKEIRDSLSSIIAFGGESGHNGAYVKVFM